MGPQAHALVKLAISPLGTYHDSVSKLFPPE